MCAAASWKGRVREQPKKRGEGDKSPALKFRVSLAWCGCRGRGNIPAIPFSLLSLLGFLLFNQHLRDCRGRAASLCHHRSWYSQHSLHLGLGNCWSLEWPPPLASHPLIVSTHPIPPTSCALKPLPAPSQPSPDSHPRCSWWNGLGAGHFISWAWQECVAVQS